MATDMLSLMPFLGAFIGIAIFSFLLIYIYTSLALMFIAKKNNTENAWLAWIPIANIYLMTKIGGIHAAWTLVVLLPVIPLIGSFLMMAAMVYFWWKIAEARGKPGWWGLLMLIPLVNLVIMGILAWGE